MRFKEEGEGGVHLEEEGERFFFSQNTQGFGLQEKEMEQEQGLMEALIT